VIDGTVWHRLPTGEKICVSGRYITDADNYTQAVGDTTLEYTGTGGHTFTLHTAVGYKNNKTVIKNNGSGNLTVDANSTETIDGSLTIVIAAGDSRTLVSDGSNLLII